jgi:hypothetical protein
MEFKNINNEKVEIFELGLRIKEIRETDFDSKIFFFICGDFFEKEIKDD